MKMNKIIDGETVVKNIAKLGFRISEDFLNCNVAEINISSTERYVVFPAIIESDFFHSGGFAALFRINFRQGTIRLLRWQEMETNVFRYVERLLGMSDEDALMDVDSKVFGKDAQVFTFYFL